MLKKMRWRFVFAAMSAIAAVMAILVFGINYWNYSITIGRINRTISDLMNMEKNFSPDQERKIPPGDFFGRSSPEDPYMMRYFSVHLDADGEIVRVSTDFISSVSKQEAVEYTSVILRKGKSTGFYREYRYAVKKSKEETQMFFLNVSKEQQFMKILLLISFLVAFVSLIAVFFLVVIFSKRAIRPYMDNIERQKKFITDAGHEIKTPLTSISASAEVLAMEDGENEWIKNIKNQTKRLAKLTADLVTLSRLDEENPLLEQSNFSFSEAVWEIVEPFISLSKAKHKNFSYQVEEDLILYGSRTSIQQMISILLDNALKYSDKHGEIRLNVYRKHKNIVLEVFNTCDIKETADIDRVFERFYRLDSSRSFAAGGYGIGLSIAKATAEAHNGKISVKCENERSIRFQVILRENGERSDGSLLKMLT